MRNLELYRRESYELRIRGARDGVLDATDTRLAMAFLGADGKPIHVENALKIFAWRIRPYTFINGYAPPISKSACLTPFFFAASNGLIRSDDAQKVYARLLHLGAGPYMIEAEVKELGTGLLMSAALEVGLY